VCLDACLSLCVCLYVCNLMLVSMLVCAHTHVHACVCVCVCVRAKLTRAAACLNHYFAGPFCALLIYRPWLAKFEGAIFNSLCSMSSCLANLVHLLSKFVLLWLISNVSLL
jgi:hypothetical protein